MKKIFKYPLFFLIGGFILVFSFLDIVTPERTYSENENRVLASFPKATFSTLMDGSFALKYEDYVAQQVFLRDNWISLKSVGEVGLLKTENNGIVYGKDGYMFSKFYEFDQEYLRDNLSAVYKFCKNTGGMPIVMVVPSAYCALDDYLPNGLPTVDESSYINYINEFFSDCATVINVKNALTVDSEKYIYYRTDHHWTTYGAYIGYSQMAATLGLNVAEYGSFDKTTVQDFLGTSYNKSKYAFAEPDTLEVVNVDATITIGDNTYEGLFNPEMLDKRDKYAGFIYGNNGISVIESEYSPNKRNSILVVKDSFANSMVPFLTQNYNKITVVDPRYYVGSFKELAKGNYTDVLVLFSFENLANDSSIAKLGF